MVSLHRDVHFVLSDFSKGQIVQNEALRLDQRCFLHQLILDATVVRHVVTVLGGVGMLKHHQSRLRDKLIKTTKRPHARYPT